MTEPPELKLASFEMNVPQLAEVWGAESDKEGVWMLARIAQLPDAEDESRTAVWVDCMYQTLLFAKQLPLSGNQTLQFFGAVNSTIMAAVTNRSNKLDAFKDFAQRFLEATKALEPPERFSLAQTKLLTAYMRDNVLQHIRLITFVLTQPRKIRRSHAEYFVQRPARTPNLSEALTTEEMEEKRAAEVAETEAAAAATATAEAEAAAAVAAEAAAAAEALPAEAESTPESTPAAGAGDALSGAISEAMTAYATELQARMEKEFIAREASVVERISNLETAATKK